MHRAKLNHSSTDGYTGMSSERDINIVCATLKSMNVDYKQHHRVTIDEAHCSKVHLGFSDEAWMKLFKNYILSKSEIRVDFSKCHEYKFSDNQSWCDPYKDMYTNLKEHHQCLVDIECALRDFLDAKKCRMVEYRDLTDARIAIGVESNNRWIFMLREYMCKYHSDIELIWCEHSLNPNEYCKCEMEQRGNVKVDVLKMICDHHSNRTW